MKKPSKAVLLKALNRTILWGSMKHIEIKLEEVREIFILLEKLNSFFHNEQNFDDRGEFKRFAFDVYPEIHKAYYETIWNWLPENTQKEFDDR